MNHRLYVITGKGGVGKTSLALAMTLELNRQGKKAKYFSFLQHRPIDLIQKLNLPSLDYELESSAEIYIARKLKSETVAYWIMRTPFFKALFQMIPGLSHMILFGHIIDELEKDPELIIVMDAPASGHALTMFESTYTFETIFKSGLIVKDIERMNRFISTKGNMLTMTVSLPSPMSYQEAIELRSALELKNIELAPLIFNDAFSPILKNCHDLPPLLLHRLKLEEEVFSHEKDNRMIAHFTDDLPNEMIINMAREVSTWPL